MNLSESSTSSCSEKGLEYESYVGFKWSTWQSRDLEINLNWFRKPPPGVSSGPDESMILSTVMPPSRRMKPQKIGHHGNAYKICGHGTWSLQEAPMFAEAYLKDFTIR